jgi:hypothetical protein
MIILLINKNNKISQLESIKLLLITGYLNYNLRLAKVFCFPLWFFVPIVANRFSETHSFQEIEASGVALKASADHSIFFCICAPYRINSLFAERNLLLVISMMRFSR